MLTDPAASMQAALESHSWTRKPQFFSLLPVTDGTNYSCCHQPGLFHCHHCCRCFKPVSGCCYCKERVTPPWESSACKLHLFHLYVFLRTCKPIPAEGPRKPLTSIMVNSIITDTPKVRPGILSEKQSSFRWEAPLPASTAPTRLLSENSPVRAVATDTSECEGGGKV